MNEIAVFLAAAAAIVVLSALANGAGPSEAPPTPRDRLVCHGEFREVSGQQVAVVCDDGRMASYTAYKYVLSIKEAHASEPAASRP